MTREKQGERGARSVSDEQDEHVREDERADGRGERSSEEQHGQTPEPDENGQDENGQDEEGTDEERPEDDDAPAAGRFSSVPEGGASPEGASARPDDVVQDEAGDGDDGQERDNPRAGASGSSGSSGTSGASGASGSAGANKVADRCYRSPSGVAGGVALLAVGGWLSIDAILNGSGRAPVVTFAALLCFVPLVVAYTMRPAVFAGRERLLVRNPLRTITVPWPSVESLQAKYTSEVIADDRKFQLWAIPVSLKARKGANRHNERVRSGQQPRGFLGFGRQPGEAEPVEKRAASDEAMGELRDLALRHGADGVDAAPPGSVRVRWAFELLGPAVLGAVALVVLAVTG